MRVLRFLFTAAIVFGIGGGIVALIGREVLLVIGVAQVRTAISEMKSANRDKSQFARQCEQKGALIDTDLVSAIQLRFISSTEYVVEVVCGHFTLDPIIVSRHTLPFLVTKVPGSGGIVWGDEPSGLAIEVYGRTRAIIVEQQEAFYESYSKESSLGRSPVTSCSGYGYECCQEESSQGVGNSISTATDCPRTCFSSCKERPVVLSLNTDPFMDIKTRIVKTSTVEAVTFSYVVSAPVLPATVTVDYGDGQVDTSTELSGSVTHTYACDQASCEYGATISVVDGSGTTSAPISVSEVRILVTP